MFFQQLQQQFRVRYAHECALFHANRDEVAAANRHMLRSGLVIALLLSSALIIIALLLPSFREMLPAYLLVLLLTLTLFCIFRAVGRRSSCLALLYCLFCLFFAFGFWLSIGVSTQTIGSSIIGMFCLVPVLIMDRTHRINLFIIGVFVLYCVLAYRFKPAGIFLSDVVTSGCFVVAGIWLSGSLRMTKLENFDLQRLSAIQEETDFLTGLSNRRCLFRAIQAHESVADAIPATGFLMIDIDWFKHFNDTKGHLAGDACLQTLGETMLLFGASNQVAFFRYGGEEFVGLCNVDDSEALVQLAESLRKTVEALQIPHESSEFHIVTVSIGCARMPDPPCSHERLIGMADMALYRAKGGGRNRVALYTAALDSQSIPVASCRQTPRA